MTKISKDWKQIKLEDLAIKKGLVRGPFGGSLKKSFFVKDGYKVYEQKNAIYGKIQLGKYFIDEKKYQELIRFSILPNDFIVSCSGTIGKIFQIPSNAPKGVINQALLKIRLDNNKIVNSYFYYYFIWEKFQSNIIDNTQGGAMQNLVGMSIFKNTKLNVPPLPEQHRIVSVLETWDRAIEKLTQKIEHKKNIKKGLMQDLLNGKKRLEGFSGAWETVELGDISMFINGYTFKSSTYIDEGIYKIITIANVQDGFMYIDNAKIISELPLNINDEQILKCGDILISMTGNVGRVCIVTYSNCLLNQRVGKIVVKNIDKDFLYMILLDRRFLNRMIAEAQGGAQANLSTEDIKGYIVDVPKTKQEQQAIAEILATADQEITTLGRKLSLLRDQKKYLLNTLITGDIRTPEGLTLYS